MIKRDPFNDDKVILVDNDFVYSVGFWYRLVIKYVNFKFDIYISEEKNTSDGKLDDNKRKEEMSESPKYTLYDAGYKEGAIGW